MGDIVAGIGASTDSGVNRVRLDGDDFSATASWNLLHNFVHSAEKLNKEVHVGNIFSSDLFYDPRGVERFENLASIVNNVMNSSGVNPVEFNTRSNCGCA